jgi:hypothetical protein
VKMRQPNSQAADIDRIFSRKRAELPARGFV